MKNLTLKRIALTALLGGALAIPVLAQPGNGMSQGPQASAPAATPLSAAETADLQFMREEEKLAHDVYVALHAKWGAKVFLNISQSETTHTTSIKTLLDRYGIADPVAGKKAGEFADPKLTALYKELVAEGGASLPAALKVGQKIEELDIKDLDERIARTNNADIKVVYANLRRGSENHLRAFTGTGGRR